MKKEFWEQFIIGDDHILTDNFTGERLGFFVNPVTKEVRFMPEYQYKKMMQRRLAKRTLWASLCNALKRFSRFNR